MEKKICTICKGAKVLHEGLWDHDGHTCGHCGGTGEEPSEISTEEESEEDPSWIWKQPGAESGPW